MQELENTLFPESGIVNWNYYEETLLGNPMASVAETDLSTFKGVEELVLSEEDED